MNIKNKKLLIGLSFMLLAIIIIPDIYYVCDFFGITLAPSWYRRIIDGVAAGSGLISMITLVLKVTVPIWMAAVLAAFSVTSA